MQTKYLLNENDMPKEWYNILADLKTPLDPPLHPVTLQPLTLPDMLPLFPHALIEQEMTTERWIKIPEEVLDIYASWRPSPMYRAHRLEKALGTPAKIFYKWEGVSPAGSHKPNTAIAQAYYNKKEGIKRIATETGAGQWGSSMSLAGAMFGLEVTVYMVRASHDAKPYRRLLMETWGGTVFASPSQQTNAGRAILAQDPNSPGSLGIAISEAVEDAILHEDTHYALGSVLNHVLLHQTVIGLEAKKQMAMAGADPDVIIGCVGGGSNFAGMALPYVQDKMNGKNIRFLAVEPASCPTLTKGIYAYDYGDTAKMAPVVKMHTLGHDFMPSAIHAGGLRYHGMAPIVSKLVEEGIVEPIAYPQNPVFEASMLFARHEGIVPAPESSHAIRAAIDEALKAKEAGKETVILFNLSGHGHFDMKAYEDYMASKLVDHEHPEEAIEDALHRLPKLP